MTTKGEYRVGHTFNPSGDPNVQNIKKIASTLIDYIESVKLSKTQGHDDIHFVAEVSRLAALAQTDIETAAMHAVKAATKEPMKP